ncbi:hypothetical protein [Candidatus Thiodubiliella endoseptemdiera]|uniref:hypothetical protein n=1 Tax=Candidatus Thiodubiliella endoseptemdiera TaxID=2738886 RepID=UPI0034DF88C7
MSNILVKTLKDDYDILWPSFFAVVVCLFTAFLAFVNNYDLDEGSHYLIFFISLIANFAIYWILFIIQIYIVVEEYFFIKKHQLFFIFYFLFFIFYFLFFIFYFLFFIFFPNSIQNLILSGLMLIYQTFAVLFLLNFLYEILFKTRKIISKYSFVFFIAISDFFLRYIFSGTLYLNIDSPYYQDNLFLISLTAMLTLTLLLLTKSHPKALN